MALLVRSLSLLLLSLFSSPAFAVSGSDHSDREAQPPFIFSWQNNNSNFKAGDVAVINVVPMQDFGGNVNASMDITTLRPTLTVNGKSGNSCYVSGVVLEVEENHSNWRIVFTPIRAGSFDLHITDEKFQTFSTILRLDVVPGPVYPSVCFVSWRGLMNEFTAGSKAAVSILPKDAFGNNISSTSEPLDSHNFTANMFHRNGLAAGEPNITYMGMNELGLIIVELLLTIAGNFSLQVLGQGRELDGSPLSVGVKPGHLDISSCQAKTEFETNAWQIYSKIQMKIHQMDQYGNLVPGLLVFDADVIEVETNLSIPIVDLYFEEVSPGIQLLSFHAVESGKFLLNVFGERDQRIISNMPYAYNVFAGFCNGSTSVINGTGLNRSTAGEIAEFSVYLNDYLQYPSAIEVERLQVKIVRQIDSYHVQPIVYPLQKLGVNSTKQVLVNPRAGELAPSANLSNHSAASSIVWASSFHVIYTPEKSGVYEITVQSGNVLLNGGQPFQKEVIAGEVNMSLSGIVKLDLKVPQQIQNEVVVKLMDSLYNPVLSQHSRLKLEVVSKNNSGSSKWMFRDNRDGSYTSQYTSTDAGSYELCVSFDGQRFSSCPFPVNVYNSGYFPKANDDLITVLEDESIGFDALENDYFAGSSANIIEFSQPGYGSVLQYGRLLRYTPYRDFHGTDSFTYTVSDANGNHDTGFVTVHILKKPPEFLSFPSQLEATEDVISPRFGGYSGLSITSSDSMEHISVTFTALHGTVSVSPMIMEFGQPGLSITKGNLEREELILHGPVEFVNSALQSFQYLGNENFNGGDMIQVSTRNANGNNVLDIPISVEPVNDPPFVSAPEFIILSIGRDKSLIFDRRRDKFDFFVGDPDLPHFPGGAAHFIVTFSAEVNDGFLLTSLPAELINTTELKLKNVHRWQPLHTYVTISKQFMVKAVGIRFQGTINDCNNVLQQLYYQGGDRGAALTLIINDLGNYGCYPDCAEKSSMPLHTEATVNLIRRTPMSSLLANSLGSAIIVELILVLFLGVLLLFFTCKCAVLLARERRSRNSRVSGSSSMQNFHIHPSTTTSPENATCFPSSNCLRRSWLGGRHWRLRQRVKLPWFRKPDEDEVPASIAHRSQSSDYPSHETHNPAFAPLAIEKDRYTV